MSKETKKVDPYKPNNKDVITLRKIASNEDVSFFNDKGEPSDSDTACALSMKVKNNTIYKALLDKNNKLFNPISSNNKEGFKLKEVREQGFNMYLGFLQTRYDSYLTKAEREIK